MARWHFDNVPDDLDQEMRGIAKRDCVSLKAAVVQRLRGVGLPHENPTKDTRKAHGNPTKFTPPTKEQMRDYFLAEGSGILEAAKCWDHFARNGWMAGKVPMKDWEAAARNWIRNEGNFTGGGNGYAGGRQERQLSATEARVERSKRNILEGLAAANRDRPALDGVEREGGTRKGTGG